MKPFLEVITEQSPNDKLDKLTHNIPLSTKRLKQLNKFSDLALMFDFEGWQNYPPPSNSSKVAFDEIQYLIGLQEFRDQWETDMRMHDTKVMKAFGKYVDKHNLEVDLDEIKRISDQADSIILSLKRFYNRPRPKVLANKLGLGFSFFPLKTAETPSYPSGHATQGRLVAKLIADEVPFKHRADIIRIGEDIGEGRMVAGAHYPSDTNFGHLLADELYRLAKEPKEPELKLETLLDNIPRHDNIEYMTEAPLSGRTVNYSQATGAFYKYVEMADDPNKDYETLRDAKLYDVENHEHIADIAKGSKLKIIDRYEKDLKMLGRSYAAKIKINGNIYLCRLSDILKPTGKQVDYIKVDLKDKLNPKVWEPFKGGHGHEGQIANVFIKGSGGNWEFEHTGEEYHINRIGAPTYKGPGNAKTDLYVKLDKGIKPYGTELKLSLKADNATWIENWMKPVRFEQIFTKRKAKQLILGMLDRLNNDEIGGRSPTMHWFVKDKGYNSIKLTKPEVTEAISGANKFGKSHEATANCFFKGGVPREISTLIKRLVPIANHKITAGLHIRGYGQQTGSACFIKVGSDWRITDPFLKHFNLPASKYGIKAKPLKKKLR